MENEKWKTIKGNKYYEISSFGRVRNKERGNILKPSVLFGRHIVSLCTEHGSNPKQRAFYVDNLVAFNFLIPPYTISTSVIKHKDGNYLNDNVNNLCFRKDYKTNACLVSIYLFKDNKCKLVSNMTYYRAKRYLNTNDATLLHALSHTSVIKSIDGREYKVEYKFNK